MKLNNSRNLDVLKRSEDDLYEMVGSLNFNNEVKQLFVLLFGYVALFKVFLLLFVELQLFIQLLEFKLFLQFLL